MKEEFTAVPRLYMKHGDIEIFDNAFSGKEKHIFYNIHYPSIFSEGQELKSFNAFFKKVAEKLYGKIKKSSPKGEESIYMKFEIYPFCDEYISIKILLGLSKGGRRMQREIVKTFFLKNGKLLTYSDEKRITHKKRRKNEYFYFENDKFKIQAIRSR